MQQSRFCAKSLFPPGAAFGARNPMRDLYPAASYQDELEMSHVFCSQIYNGVPVLGGNIPVHVGTDNQVSSANGNAVFDIKAAVTPAPQPNRLMRRPSPPLAGCSLTLPPPCFAQIFILTARSGAGAGGVDRVEIIFADRLIMNHWLEVSVLAGLRTGLIADDVFYFGNLAGDTGNFCRGAARRAPADFRPLSS